MADTLLNQAQNFSAGLRPKKVQTGPGEIYVDPHFIEDPRAAKVLEFAFRRRKNALLVGPTGCGKSCLAINVAARLQESIEPFSCEGETSTDHLIGKPWKRPTGETVTVYGAAARAYKNGKILLLEEVDMANADILASLHRIMEVNQGYMVLNVGEEEIIEKNPNFCVVATANTIGTGEDTFMYAGTKPLNQAFMNRFSLTVRMDYLPPDKEQKVLEKKTGIDAQIAQKLVQIAQEAREANKQDVDRTVSTISTRDLLEWSEAIVGMDMDILEASWYAFLNRANEADVEVIQRIITNRL